jgi:hypothetical protein
VRNQLRACWEYLVAPRTAHLRDSVVLHDVGVEIIVDIE